MITEKEEHGMKKLYEQPELEIIKFQMEDVMNPSGDLEEDELPPVVVG